MLVDSGSSTTIIDRNTFNKIKRRKTKLFLRKTKVKLYPYGTKQPLKMFGKFETSIESERKICVCEVYVVDKPNSANILGLNMSTELGLMKMNLNQVSGMEGDLELQTECDLKVGNNLPKSFKTLIKEYGDIFKGTGMLKNYQCDLFVDENILPVQQKLRRQPYYLRKKIRNKLYELERKKIIESVNTPQPWISNIVETPKANGEVWLRLDAREINKAIRREKFPIPTLDSLIDSMSGAKYFRKIDLRNAYTQIELSERARNLTTFITDERVKRYKCLI